jgi:hypothetical protein
VRVDDAGRHELARSVDDLCARRNRGAEPPIAAILPSRITMVPLLMVPREAVTSVALRMATTPDCGAWGGSPASPRTCAMDTGESAAAESRRRAAEDGKNVVSLNSSKGKAGRILASRSLIAWKGRRSLPPGVATVG